MKKIGILWVIFLLLPLGIFAGQAEKYLGNRIDISNHRYATFAYALKLLKKNGANILVETGTARNGDQNFNGDGGSTIIFGDWASQNGATLYSVDLSSDAIKNAMDATKNYSVQFRCGNSVKFLKNFKQPIDFLYLDSYDFETDNPEPSQKHHLKEIKAAYPHLHEKSIVMIDDCDLPHGGKGALVIDFLTVNGWQIVFKGYQVILTRS